MQQLERLTGKRTDYRLASGLDPKLVSFLIAYNDGFTFEEKQRFLEMTSTSDRLKKTVESLRKIVKRTQIVEHIRHIIGGNGNLRKPLT